MKSLTTYLYESIDIDACCDVYVLNQHNEILLIKRPATDDSFHNTWCIPGGHRQVGETLEESAKRECLEESGINLDNVTLFRHHTYSDGFKTSIFYAQLDHTPMVALSDEHTDAMWVNPHKAMIMPLQGELPFILKDFFKYLNLI